MHSTVDYAQQLLQIEQTGVVVMHDVSRFSAYHVDFVCPYMTILIVERGSARVLYDMQEFTQGEHGVSCVMAGHLIHPIECSEDFLSTVIVVSSRLDSDLPFHTFSHDYNKFNLMPFCQLTANQAQRMLAITEQLEAVANQAEEDLPHRHDMMLSLLSIGYEYLNLYRREQDSQWENTRHAGLLGRFCNLVVEHYTEEREVQFYADALGLTPKYLTRVICSLTGGMSPADWIAQYVCSQARHILGIQQCTVKETAYRLGFAESASFCRFFKRVTGLTPREFRDSRRKV